MHTHNIVAGTPEWHANRSNYRNASDAPVVLGCSPYKTRTQFLDEKTSGIAQEHDAGTQARFADGHRFEALARTIGEEILDDDLAPVVGSVGSISASFDGLNLMGKKPWEHKSLNNEIRASLPHQGRNSYHHNDGTKLGKVYRVQMEQQLLVCGDTKCLFSATRWDGDTLLEERHAWYHTDPALRAEILAAWEQFENDLEDHTPVARVAEAVGRTPETLPALRIEVTGMVTASNLQQYKEHALAVFSGINRELTTDAHFADAEKVVKWCGDVEERLAAAKQHALSQTASIDELFRAIDDISAEARRTRLELDKLVKARKEQLRSDIVAAGIAALKAHIAELNQLLGHPYMPTVPADFGGAIKNKRTIDSLRDAVNTTLANAKIEAIAIATKIQFNRELLNDELEYGFLFPDSAQILLKAPDDFKALVQNRIAEHKAKESARLERIRAEEQEKAERAARQKLADEQEAEAQRVAKALAESMKPEPKAAAVPALTHAQVVQQMPATVRAAMAPKPATAPTMSLGDISTKLGFNVTSAFLASLGFEATTVKAARLFHAEDFQAIGKAIIEHIESVCELQAA